MSSIRRLILNSNLKFALAVLVAVTFFAVHPSSNVSAKTKRAKFGTIKILTTPGGLLLTIDGKPRGETLTEYRAFDLEPGVHNVAHRPDRTPFRAWRANRLLARLCRISR